MLAQAPPEMPKLGAEHKRMGYFVGNWKGEADVKQSPSGPAVKLTFTERIEWFPGGFFLIVHAEVKGPLGEMKSLAVMGYNSDEKVYTFHSFNNLGMAESAKGTVQGDTWTVVGESKMFGKPMKARYVIQELSPTSCGLKFDSSTDGRTWSTIMEGKLTKTE